MGGRLSNEGEAPPEQGRQWDRELLAADSSQLRPSLGLNGTVLPEVVPPSPDKAISSDSLILGNESLPSFSRVGTT